jgi:heme A synthase
MIAKRVMSAVMSWTSLGRAVVIGAIVIGALAVGASATLACSGSRLIGDADPPADLVFTGTAVRMDDPDGGLTLSTADTLRWTFVVDEVVSGDVGGRVVIGSARAGGSCGVEFQLGQRYLVRANDSPDGLPMAWANSGTRQIEPLPDPPRVEGAFVSPWQFANRLGLPALAVLLLLVAVLAWRATQASRRVGRVRL